MALTSLGPCKFIQDMGSEMGSSSHGGLIMVPGQESNDDNLGKSYRTFTQ